MKKYPVLAVMCFMLIFFMIVHNSANSEGLTGIELIDGTIITGELISFNNGIYTISSTTLGTLKIKETNIKGIHSKSLPPETPSAITPQTGIQSLQKRMMGDEDLMQMVTSLLQDPDFLEILQDDALMRAISSGDINALKANPKLQKLLNNPTFERIKKGLE